MAKMPGQLIEGAWSPEEDSTEQKKARAFKPEMSEVKPPPGPVFSGPDDSAPATFTEPSKPSLYERMSGNFRYMVDHGFFASGELIHARLAKLQVEEQRQELDRMNRSGEGGSIAAKRLEQSIYQTAGDYELTVGARAERNFQYEAMPGAETPLEMGASVIGGFAGAIDPTIVIPEVRLGTTAWRYASPVVARMLDYGVTNAVTNAAINAGIQAGEMGADIREEIDYDSILIDAGVGAAVGVPFGYASGRAAKNEMAQIVQAPLPGPRVEAAPERPAEVTTVESLSQAHAPEEIATAQETLFGEVVGTRNLTPEQLNQVDDYINAGKPYGENLELPVQTVPEVREPAQSQAEPLPQVPERGQPEGSQSPAPANEGPPPGAREPAPLVASDYQDFKPEDLKVDAKRFQFKGGGDEEGVIDTLKKVKTWDRKKSGTIIVWQDLAGNNYVVDGHQRYGLAKRLKGEGQDPVLHAMIWREADGITAEDAKVMAADINISQGSGTAVDAAKVLRARPEMMQNLPKNAVTEHGVGLARLSDDAFGMVVNGKVPPEYGSLVGKIAPNTSTHAQIMDVLAKNEPASAAQAESMIRDVLSAPEVEQTMSDMFGSSEVTQILFKERAQVLSSAATALRKDRAALNTLVKEEARLSGAGNKLATATNIERAQTDAEILATLQATARRKGPVADALAAAAKSLHDGTPRQVAVREFLDRLRGEVKGASPDGEGLPASPQSIAASLGGYRNTDSPAFGRWFGDSKVVDENGDPMVMYHVGNKDIEAFRGMPTSSWLIYFNPTPEGARAGARNHAAEYAVYIKAETPFNTPDNPLRWHEAEARADRIKSDGYDAIYVKDEGGISLAVFNPTQIKSIYNRGTWDANDPRIAFSAPRQAGSGLFDAPPKAGALSPQMERMLTLAKGKMGAPDNIYGDQLNEAQRKGWVTGRESYTKAGGNRVTRYHITPSGEAALAGKFDVGADGKPQAVLPGAERISDKTLAERRAAAPLKAAKPQKDMDFGLFGGGGSQMDLVDLARLPKMVKQDADYLDFSPSGTAKNAIIGKASITYAAKDGEVEILAFRVPTQFRRRGEGREALLAFLEKADDEGLAVRAYSTPLDRSTDPEGVVRFYESLGFTATGRKVDRAGNLEMLRSGPPPEVAELRRLVGTGRLIPLRDYTEPSMAQQVSAAFYNSQPARTIDDIYDTGLLQKHQDRLAAVAEEIATETGAVFKNPGIKSKATAAQKMNRKRYKTTKQLADLVRGGFIVETPDQAQKVVNMLAGAFKVLDEGWAISPHGYFDRKAMVQFADGTIGEVQIWEPRLLKAKMEQGHELYAASRDLPPGPARQELEDAMTELYSGVLAELDPSWLATVGRGGNGPNVPENSARMASSEASSLPESPTSGASTSSQSSPRSNMAQALPPDMTAGRPSQSTNFMETSVSGKNMGDEPGSQASQMSQDPLAEPGPWREAMIEVTLDDGTRANLQAGAVVDFLQARIKSAKQLMECVNAA